MSRSGEIALEFGGEERVFCLKIKHWEKVQEKCDAGPAELLARLATAFFAHQRGMTTDQIIAAGLLGSWRIHDVREVILQGLRGGGMEDAPALRLVKDWVDDANGLIGPMAIAYQIVRASIEGAPDERSMGEPAAATEAASQTSPEESSASGKTASTPSAAPLVGPQP